MEAAERALEELWSVGLGLGLAVAAIVVWGKLWDALDLGDVSERPADTPNTGGVNRAPLPWDDYPDREEPPEEES